MDLLVAGQQARENAEQASWAKVTQQFDQHVHAAIYHSHEQKAEQIQTMV